MRRRTGILVAAVGLALAALVAVGQPVGWKRYQGTGATQRIGPIYNLRCEGDINCGLDGSTMFYIGHTPTDAGPPGVGGTTIPPGCDAGVWVRVRSCAEGGSALCSTWVDRWVPSVSCGDAGPNPDAGGTYGGFGPYWLATDAGISGSVIMGEKSTGLVINTTTTGVPTIYGGDSCGAGQYASSISATGVVTCSTPPLWDGGSGLAQSCDGGWVVWIDGGTAGCQYPTPFATSLDASVPYTCVAGSHLETDAGLIYCALDTLTPWTCHSADQSSGGVRDFCSFVASTGGRVRWSTATTVASGWDGGATVAWTLVDTDAGTTLDSISTSTTAVAGTVTGSADDDGGGYFSAGARIAMRATPGAQVMPLVNATALRYATTGTNASVVGCTASVCSGLWGVWSLENNALDSTSNGRNGTPTSLTYGVGIVGDAGVFNGSSSWVDLPDTTPTTVSFSAWFKTSYSGAAQVPIALWVWGGVGSGRGIYAECATNGTLRVIVTKESNCVSFPYAYAASSTATCTNGSWHHVVGVYNGSAVIGWYDGSTMSGGAAANCTGVSFTGADMSLGKLTTGGAEWWNGSVDEAAVWPNVVLDGIAASYLFNSGFGRTYPWQ